MKNKTEKYLPVGVSAKKELTAIMLGFGVAVLSSTSYFLSFSIGKNSLYEYIGNRKFLIEGKTMPDFYKLIEGKFDVFIITILMMIILIGLHYSLHFRDSKSIYTMKRLPQKGELLKRCITVPVISIIFLVTVSSALMIIYYFHYIHYTPEGCLTSGQIEKLLHHIIYGGV